MIVKIKSHKRAVFGKVLEYMVNNKDRLFDARGNTFVITRNLKSNTISKWEQQYKANELTRLRHRKDSIFLTHEILSWHKDDAKHITLEKMEDMARQYIRERNPNGIYVAVPHFDKQHYHIHVCASGIEYKTGKSLRMSKADMQRLKVNIQKYQVEKFPELSKSIVAHGKNDKARVTDKEYQFKHRTGRETDKEYLGAVLKTCYKKANSKETFFELLKECGIDTYERSGKVTGIVHNDMKFRFNRLGFTEERFNELDQSMTREKELKSMRGMELKETKNQEVQALRETPEQDENMQDEGKNTSREDELNDIRNYKNETPQEKEIEK